MKTNNFFEFDRFVRLLKQDLLFNYKFYLSFLFGLGIGIFLFSFFIIRNFGMGQYLLSAYYLLYSLLLGAIMVFVGLSFPSFRNLLNTRHYLLMPGSAFEKILVQFVVRFILFIPLALLLLRVTIFLATASMSPDPKSGFDPLFVKQFNYGELFTRSEVLQNNPLRDLSYLFIAFAGSVYFNRFAVVKTLGVMVFIPTMLFLVIKLTGGQINWTKIGTDYLNGYNFFFMLAPLFIGVLLFSLPWAYFKLKEREL